MVYIIKLHDQISQVENIDLGKFETMITVLLFTQITWEFVDF